jgi:hypothetical protein
MGTESLSDRGLTMYEGLMNWEDAVKAMTFLKDWAPPNGVSVRYEIRESTIHGFWLLALYLEPTVPYTEGRLGFQVQRMPDETTLGFLTQAAMDFIEDCLGSN